MLESTNRPLVAGHDLVMFDLDGVVYVSGHAIQHAAGSIARTREAGVPVVFVTNNASRTPRAVAERMRALGIAAEPDEVVTSAQAAASLLLADHGEGARILVLGTSGLTGALECVGLVPVLAGAGGEDDTVAVVSGYGPDVRWKHLMAAAVRIGAGLPWVATNADYSLPTDHGPAPGHGVQVQMLSRFTGVDPVVVGKPARLLFDEAVRRGGRRHPLMVGDRLDTDIEGALAAGIPSLLVLTGVADLAGLVAAPAGRRPTYLHPDTRGLHEPHPRVEVEALVARCGGWSAAADDGTLRVWGSGAIADWWRAVAVAGWRHLDQRGRPADVAALQEPVASTR